MSVSINTFVHQHSENPLVIAKDVSEALKKFILDGLKRAEINANLDGKRWEYLKRMRDGELPSFTTNVKFSTDNFTTFVSGFHYENEIRNLFYFTGCHTDHSDIAEGEKLIFSINDWGHSREIMDVIHVTLAEFGDVYTVVGDEVIKKDIKTSDNE